MAVSKRLRYEILLRDNHTCRYCGGAAPDVPMTVDHVVPKALGGSDEPSNLVAACRDCNSGKSSSTATASQVADVAADAVRWAAAMKQAADEVSADDNSDVCEAVMQAWVSYRRNQIPSDFGPTIDGYLKGGLPPETIIAMAELASTKPGVVDRWPYFCGCCRRNLEQLQARASELIGNPTVEASLTTRWTQKDIDQLLDEAEEMASGLRVLRMNCIHNQTGTNDHCGDPVCAVQYGERVLNSALDYQFFEKDRRERDNAVMDELDAIDEVVD